MILRLIPVLAITLLITGCDVASVLGPDPRTAQREADGRAIGGACRRVGRRVGGHGQRGIEDCYKLNERAPKTAIFEGWKDMDRYMRENKIDGIASTIPANSSEVMLTDNSQDNKAEAKH